MSTAGEARLTEGAPYNHHNLYQVSENYADGAYLTPYRPRDLSDSLCANAGEHACGHAQDGGHRRRAWDLGILEPPQRKAR